MLTPATDAKDVTPFSSSRNAPRLIFHLRISEALRKSCRVLRDTEAAELLEFGLTLPLILVMLVGIMDFARAYTLKQKLTNAAREGARLGASEMWTADGSSSSPQSVQDIHSEVVSYLHNAGVDTSFIGATMNYDTATTTATYYSSGDYGLKIERNIPVTTGGKSFWATRVTLACPYDWTFGFNHVIDLIVPAASVPATIGISTDAMMLELQP